ncbi:DUF3352 domain-containing protein [Rhodopirellula sp. JC740]|uniref:DUF3352 domain-containing protein n=1 Tax=Rhodopirellula halodulae TaxID=2894198 RepID=A0ABS8NDY4_9BACT|nr:DUF3352 domain-containing protein [Rhodopirellula sp. JC740]MCC9641038.1 DUF3352 domain-containing protein [Rhodopirellula sp. JC740]
MNPHRFTCLQHRFAPNVPVVRPVTPDFSLRATLAGRWFVAAVLAATLVCFQTSPAFAQSSSASAEPTRTTVPAPKLLPAETLAYIRVDDVNSIRADWETSSLGKMLNDPQMRPFVSDIYDILSELFDNVGKELGLTLDELRSLPQGQLAVALLEGPPPEENADNQNTNSEDEDDDEAIARRLRQKRRQQNSFAVAVMIDAGPSNRTMSDLVDRLMKLAEKNRFVIQTEQIGSIEMTRLVRQRGNGDVIEWFEQDGFYVIGFGRTVGKDIAKRLLASQRDDTSSGRSRRSSSSSESSETSTLAQNTDFVAVMSRSIGAEAEIPQTTFFINPYGIVKRIIARSGSAFFIAPIVQDLGIEKIRGVGGSMFRGGEIVETIGHVHVLIDPPRDGFFGVLRPEDTDVSPPDWVPADSASFTTVGWDIETAFENLGKIVNRFAGEGRFKDFTEKPVQDRFGVSLAEEVFPAMTGRVVTIQRYQLPANWNSMARVIAIEFSDAKEAKRLLEQMKSKVPPKDMKPEVIRGKTVYFAERPNFNAPIIRVPERSLMLLDNWLLLSDSREIIVEVLKSSDGEVDRLSADEDYVLLTSELGAKLEGETPFLFQFNRDSESFRILYEMANSEGSATVLENRGGDNPMTKRVAELMRRDDWPEWETLEKYFSVSGIFGYDEPGGIHIGTMNLRPIE